MKQFARDIIEFVLWLCVIAALITGLVLRTPGGPAEPKWLTLMPDGADDSHGRLEDCFSRLTDKNKKIVSQNDKFGPPDKPNVCHEATHFLNSQLRCANDPEHPNDNAVYIDHGRYLLFEEPKVTLTQVFSYLDEETHAHTDDVMHTSKEWEKEPLYCLDEWSAYINGTKCCLEVNAPSERLRISRLNMGRACMISQALVKCIEEHDPTYPQLADLKAFVAWQTIRTAEIIR